MRALLAITQRVTGKIQSIFTSSQNQGTFSKRQQARNIGKCNLTLNFLHLDYVQLRIQENYHCASGYALSISRGYVNTGNKAWGDNFVFSYHPFRQTQLYFPSSGSAHLPPV